MFASTGSSTVIMLTSSVLSSLNAVYNVVDLPEPVGPVTRMIPCGFFNILSNFSNSSSEKPKFFLSLVRFSLEVKRITTFSPLIVGNIDTRTS